MNRCFTALAALSLALAASATLGAQTSAPAPSMAMPNRASAMPAPPNILLIETDNIKAYNTTPYDKVAEQYVAVAKKYNLPGSAIAMEAMSGATREQFLFAYDSFQDMQNQNDAMMKNAAVTEAFAHLDSLEAQYTTEVHQTIWHYRDDLSNNAAAADIPHCVYWETIVFHIKPGHDSQFEGLIKTVQATYAKIGANISWATFESEMGATDTYNIIVPMKSLKDEDDALARDKSFAAALGADGQHQMDQVASESYLSVEDTLWMVNPKTSYVPKEMIAANPDFWAPKPAAPTGKSTTAMPAMKPKAKTAPAQ